MSALSCALRSSVWRQKLQLRLSDISTDRIGAWQPGRAMDILVELVDPDLTRDAVLCVGSSPGGGAPAIDVFTPIGTNKGIDPRAIAKHCHKLGSYLHIMMPKKKGEHPKDPDPDKLRKSIGEVISYIDDVTSTRFDAHFSEKVTFTCGDCDQLIVRNPKLLKERDVVQCQNPACDASYIAYEEGERFLFKPYMLTIECNKCGEKMPFNANKFLALAYDRTYPVICKCGARHQVRWMLRYGLLEDATQPVLGGQADV